MTIPLDTTAIREAHGIYGHIPPDDREVYDLKRALDEVDRLRADVTDPDGTPWRDRAFDCARDLREAPGYRRDDTIVWGDLVRWVRRLVRERDEARAELARLKSSATLAPETVELLHAVQRMDPDAEHQTSTQRVEYAETRAMWVDAGCPDLPRDGEE